jgi:hypothetical protein
MRQGGRVVYMTGLMLLNIPCGGAMSVCAYTLLVTAWPCALHLIRLRYNPAAQAEHA